MADNSTPLRPEFMIDGTLTAEEVASMESLQSAIRRDPSFVQLSLDLYSQAPQAVDGVINFIREHPEGLQTLETLGRVFRARLDLEVEFDPDTEGVVARDPYCQKALEEIQANAGNPPKIEAARDRYRKHRMGIFIRRTAA